MMKKWLKLLLAVFGCELTGILGAFFTFTAIPTWYVTLNKPVFAPPNWIFGPVWTLLYASMGIAFYLIWKQEWRQKQNQTARKWFFIQLALNFIWSPVFFGLRAPLLGLVIIIAMWVAIVLTIRSFYSLSKTAAYLLVPYLLWVSFATILNAAIVGLN